MSDHDTGQADLTPDDLKQAAVSGVRWATAARVASEIVSLASAVILARLIAPAEFGEAVVPLIFVPLAVILTFEGFGSALVQRKAVDQDHIEAAMLASLVSGVLLSATTFLLADPVGGRLFGDQAAQLLQMVSPIFVLASAGVVSRSLLWRRLDFRRINLIEVASLTFGAVSAVAMAIAGLEAEAIVLGALFANVVTATMLLVSEPPPMPRWHHVALREVMGFGLPASAAGLTYVAISNATLAVAAARLSALQVGLYWRAFQVGVSWQSKISNIMMQLALPIYSRTTDLDELRRYHERATRIHAAVLLPLLSFLIVLAPDLIPWAFGQPWAPAAGAIQILAVAGMIAAVLTGYPQVLLAAGHPRALFNFNMILLTLFGVTSWIAAPYGITALSLSVVGVHVVMIVAVYGVLFNRFLGIPTGRMVSDIIPAAVCSVALLAVTFPFADLLHNAGVPVPVLSVLVGVVGTLVYATGLRGFFPVVWNDVVLLVVRVMPSGVWAVRVRRFAAPGAAEA